MATVVADRATVFTDTALERHPYFSWGAAFAGALSGTMVTFVLLAIGAGLGLVFVGPVNDAAPVKTVLTVGGIYFFAVEAFGFAVGGYLAGRLCGPLLQSRDEEMFRSGAHGLVVWALNAAALLIFLTVGAAIATATAGSVVSVLGLSSPVKGPGGEVAPATAAYWSDTLLRVPAQGVVSAPAATPQTTPAPVTVTPLPNVQTPAPTPAPSEIVPAPTGEPPAATDGEPGPGVPAETPQDESAPSPGDDEMPVPAPSPAVYVPHAGILGGSLVLTPIQYSEPSAAPQVISIAPSRRVDPEARSEIARILTANAIALDKMSADDRRYIERSIIEQTGITPAEAHQRTDALIARIKDERTKAAEAARKAGAYIHIWLGLSLFFGLLVATGAAVLARMEDEEKREEVVVAAGPTIRTEPPVITG